MKPRRPIARKTETSPFLGIATGKRVAAKAEAARLLEEEKRKTLMLMQQQAQAGYNPEQNKIDSALKAEELKATAEIAAAKSEGETSNTLYYIIGAVVIAVMIGLYFITRNR